jgi:hypothetical protein
MGIEYKIKFAVPADYSPKVLLGRLPSSSDGRAIAEIYGYAVEADGFYFIDHLVDRAVAAVALRCLIDEALRFAQSIEIDEP